jgi:hypothetical protein
VDALLRATTAAGITAPCWSEMTPCKELVDWACTIDTAAIDTAASKLIQIRHVRKKRTTDVLIARISPLAGM